MDPNEPSVVESFICSKYIQYFIETHQREVNAKLNFLVIGHNGITLFKIYICSIHE